MQGKLQKQKRFPFRQLDLNAQWQDCCEGWNNCKSRDTSQGESTRYPKLVRTRWAGAAEQERESGGKESPVSLCAGQRTHSALDPTPGGMEYAKNRATKEQTRSEACCEEFGNVEMFRQAKIRLCTGNRSCPQISKGLSHRK